jgi:hypothetical protein
MGRLYHIDIAVFAAGADTRWVDNLISAHRIPGVESSRRGVSRRMSTHAIYQIAIVRQLSQGLGISVDTAVALAGRLLGADDGRIPVPEHLEVRLARQDFEREIDQRIAIAVESIVPARRGRPPGLRSPRVSRTGPS